MTWRRLKAGDAQRLRAVRRVSDEVWLVMRQRLYCHNAARRVTWKNKMGEVIGGGGPTAILSCPRAAAGREAQAAAVAAVMLSDQRYCL